jgi:hypothetical protein
MPMEATLPRGWSPAKLAAILLAGAAVSVALGVYGSQHQPTGQGILGNGLFFSGTINMKAWFATAVAVFAILQVISALWMYGRVPVAGPAPGWIPITHRMTGTAAFVISIPVAYQCLWGLGFHVENVSTRIAFHSVLGCFFYGAFASKMLFLRSKSLPGVALPILGGTVFASLIGIWLTSSLWFFQNIGFPQF